jgi:hypothetical protein
MCERAQFQWLQWGDEGIEKGLVLLTFSLRCDIVVIADDDKIVNLVAGQDS